MHINITISGDLNAETAQQLKDFADLLNGNMPSPKVIRPISKVSETTKPGAFAPADELSKEPEKAGEPAEAKTSDDKEPTKTSSRKARGAGKAAEPPAPEPAKPEPKAAEPEKQFTTPPGTKEALKEDEPAPPEVQQAAAAKLKEFTPKDGEPANINYCRAALFNLATQKGVEPGRKLMEKYKMKKIGDLAPEKFDAFVADINKLLAV